MGIGLQGVDGVRELGRDFCLVDWSLQHGHSEEHVAAMLRSALNLFGGTMSCFLLVHWQGRLGVYSKLAHPASRSIHDILGLLDRSAGNDFLLPGAGRHPQQVEAKQLGRGYSGSVVDAVCSCSDDDLRIHREIGGEVEAVDCAIEVLLSAGIPTLREVEQKGVSIHQAPNPQIALTVLLRCSR